MKGSVFRSAAFWKSAIMTLPDNSFFELLRSVFGKIKTPFNKQILVDDLETFLLRADIQKNIACFIDPDDARIIAAVAVLEEPASGELESFFSGELSYAQLHDLIANLEERFIMYRFREKGHSRLALNPVLEPALAPFAADISPLFPSADGSAPGMTANEAGTAAAPPLNDRILAGLLSFVSEWEPFFKNEGEIRKRIINAGNGIFPGIDLESVTGGMRVLGLLRAGEDRLFPDYRRFSGFGKLSPRERLEYAAAGIYYFQSSKSPAGVSPYLLRAHVRPLADCIHRLLNSLEAGQLYPARTLKRLIGILERDCSGGGPEAETGRARINDARLLDALEKTGLLLPASDGSCRPGPLALDSAETGAESAPEAPVIAMDTVFSCLVYPEIRYADLVDLASILSVREAGVSIRFELTRDSAVRAFNRGLSAAAIIDLLKRLSANRIHENLIWTLRDWEKRYGEIVLRRGLVLSLSPERRYLAETESLARLIKETLAPGVYLLPETAEGEAAEVLRKAGVDIIARYGERAAEAEPSGSVQNFFPAPGSGGPQRRLQNLRDRTCPRPQGKTRTTTPEPLASTLIEGFHSILAQTRFSKAERDELAARINRRLVLCESQLRDASVRYEKLEARGLDYVGKAMIAKQAIASQSPVELVMPGAAGERIFGIPKALEKEGGESILVISPPDNANGGEYLRVPLGKISLLRRIKKSLFENNT